MARDDFVARGYGLKRGLGGKDVDENFLAGIWKAIARDHRFADSVFARSSITPFLRTYPPADIYRLNDAASMRRDGRNKTAADLYELGERLRTVGESSMPTKAE